MTFPPAPSSTIWPPTPTPPARSSISDPSATILTGRGGECVGPLIESIKGSFLCGAPVTNILETSYWSITNQWTTNGCEVTLDRTYRVETCCGLADEETVTFTYIKTPDLESGPLSKLDLGCIGSVNQIPPVDLTMFAASSSCQVVSIEKVGQTDPVQTDCVWSNERVFLVETICDVTNLVTQSVCWIINDSVPEILPRTMAESFAALEIVNATQTQLISEVFMDAGCDVMVVRTWRVEDCCGNFDRAVESFLYTPASELLAAATIPMAPLSSPVRTSTTTAASCWLTVRW